MHAVEKVISPNWLFCSGRTKNWRRLFCSGRTGEDFTMCIEWLSDVHRGLILMSWPAVPSGYKKEGGGGGGLK